MDAESVIVKTGSGGRMLDGATRRPVGVRSAAGLIRPAVMVINGPPPELHRPILRMLKEAGPEAPNGKVQEIFDTL